MFIPAWKVFTLPAARSSLSDWTKYTKLLRHLDTTIHVDHDNGHFRHGQVMWGTNVGPEIAGMAWDWREVQPNVVAMSDPMALQSNLVLIDDDGEPLPESRRLLHMHNTIHALPWQEEICSLWGGAHELKHAA